MRPMIRLGNLNARPSCPAAAPGSTVWVYLYAAGHRDMPGDSPRRERASERDQGAGREICGRLCQRKAAAPVERVGSMAWVRKSPAMNRSGISIHRAHTGAIANRRLRGTDGG